MAHATRNQTAHDMLSTGGVLATTPREKQRAAAAASRLRAATDAGVEAYKSGLSVDVSVEAARRYDVESQRIAFVAGWRFAMAEARDAGKVPAVAPQTIRSVLVELAGLKVEQDRLAGEAVLAVRAAMLRATAQTVAVAPRLMVVPDTYALGKCTHCRPAYCWRTTAARSLISVGCPICGGALRQTSRSRRSAFVDLSALLDAGEPARASAYRRFTTAVRTATQYMRRAEAIATQVARLVAFAYDGDRTRGASSYAGYHGALTTVRQHLYRLVNLGSAGELAVLAVVPMRVFEHGRDVTLAELNVAGELDKPAELDA